MSVLSEKIASLRREANETQSCLADALGVSNRTVSKWENAESEPEAAMLSALADRFDTTVDALLGRREKKSDPYAGITRYDRINRFLREDDFGIFCDCGLRHLPFLQVKPGLVVGDFDSHERPDMDVETIVLPREKDDTDTFFAVKEAVRRGYDDFLLTGVIGERLDHTLANLSILQYLDAAGKTARIVDDWSEMCIVSRKETEISDDCAYFSLLAVGGPAKGIRIAGAKYPLEDGTITGEFQYGVSNEVLPGQTARISLREGRLLLVKVFRDEFPA